MVSLARSAFALLIIIVIPATARLGRAEEGPRWEERPLTAWVEDLRSDDERTLVRASGAIAEFLGQREKPTLPESLRTSLEAAILAGLKAPSEHVRRNLTYALGYLGGQATDAAPTLLNLLADPSADVRDAACRGMLIVPWRAGTVATALVARAAAWEDAELEASADLIGGALAAHPKEAREAIPNLRKLLAEAPRASQRRLGYLGLAHLASLDEKAAEDVAAVLRAFRTPEEGERAWSEAARVGPSIGAVAVRLVDHPVWSEYALGHVGSVDAEWVLPHLHVLVKRLGSMPEPPNSAEEALKSLFTGRADELQALGDKWLAQPETAGLGVLFASTQTLLRLFNDTGFGHRALALREFVEDADWDVVGPVLVKAMTDADAGVRARAAWGAGALGWAGRDLLAKAARDRSPAVRTAAGDAWRALASGDARFETHADFILVALFLLEAFNAATIEPELKARYLRWLGVPAMLLGHARARAAIEAASKDTDETLRKVALEILAPIEDAPK